MSIRNCFTGGTNVCCWFYKASTLSRDFIFSTLLAHSFIISFIAFCYNLCQHYINRIKRCLKLITHFDNSALILLFYDYTDHLLCCSMSSRTNIMWNFSIVYPCVHLSHSSFIALRFLSSLGMSSFITIGNPILRNFSHLNRVRCVTYTTRQAIRDQTSRCWPSDRLLVDLLADVPRIGWSCWSQPLCVQGN